MNKIYVSKCNFCCFLYLSELLQRLDVPEFNGTAFVELPLNAIEMIENMIIAIWFKAVKPDGKKTLEILLSKLAYQYLLATTLLFLVSLGFSFNDRVPLKVNFHQVFVKRCVVLFYKV